MQFISGDENTKFIKDFLIQESSLKLAIAFLGESAWDYFKNSSDEIFIICNLESGATNPYCVEKLRNKSNIFIRTNKRLHSKAYIGENHLITGSSNLSANGLSLEDDETKGWIEASLVSDDKSIIEESERWFDELWNNASEIDDDQIASAKIKWLKRREARNNDSDGVDTLLEALKENLLKDKPVYLAIYRRWGSDEAAEKWDSVQENYGKSFDYYEDWDEIPDNSFLIDLYYGPRGGKKIQGIYKTPEYPRIERYKNADGDYANLNIVYKMNNVLGKFTLPKHDKKIIESYTEAIWEKFGSDDDSAILVKLQDVKEFLN